MADEVRIGVEPPLPPSPRSSRVLLVAVALALLAGAGAWLAGIVTREAPPATTTGGTVPPSPTTTIGATTTLPEEARLAAARVFWSSLGAGDGVAAGAAFPATGPAAADLIGFAAAFRAGFTLGDCREFGADAVQCFVTATSGDLLSIGLGPADELVRVFHDGWFDVPALLGSAAARLSLYALENHTDELRAACPLTANPQVPRLAIVGSATPGCGAYLAGLIPEYLSAVLHQSTGPGE